MRETAAAPWACGGGGGAPPGREGFRRGRFFFFFFAPWNSEGWGAWEAKNGEIGRAMWSARPGP